MLDNSGDFPDGQSDTDQAHFLAGIHQLTGNLRNAIFVWNLESYDDIETPSKAFRPPLSTLYTVSAGFKPNRILQTHGFDANTRMVVFDYSPQGLKFRRLLQEIYIQWIEKLARKAPGLFLYGSDHQNISVNFYTAGRYAQWLRAAGETGLNELDPEKFHQVEMRF